ncbi:hypothetical protein HW130_17760 [Streptomyces sp. PKU-EA00015]|uniref:hypothetical protein n=1 Tax=Streptomyces sp. PKU-EA00015 TaxID=2748326 RepID=UPI0015A48EEC|nr:hypothetical protein [Streptomyces sp. PKU-EA00015]NWF28090.1 hypothetical protein [Streptomyces sp. PKU-EA00015]
MPAAVGHVQLAAPPGAKDAPRAYHGDVPGTAHPGLLVTGIETYARRLERLGAKAVGDEDLPGHERFCSEAPVGDRLELREPAG